MFSSFLGAQAATAVICSQYYDIPGNIFIAGLKAGASEVLLESLHGTGGHGDEHHGATSGVWLEDLIVSSLATRTGGELLGHAHHRHGHHGHHEHRHHGDDGTSAGWDVRQGPAC